MSNDIDPEIVEFVTKWAVATNQNPELASKRFWEMMCSSEISEETKAKMLDDWAAEAGIDFRKA